MYHVQNATMTPASVSKLRRRVDDASRNESQFWMSDVSNKRASGGHAVSIEHHLWGGSFGQEYSCMFYCIHRQSEPPEDVSFGLALVFGSCPHARANNHRYNGIRLQNEEVVSDSLCLVLLF